jgi:hypothetical protein
MAGRLGPRRATMPKRANLTAASRRHACYLALKLRSIGDNESNVVAQSVIFGLRCFEVG